MGVKKYKYNNNFFYKDSEELYYFLGFIASDGYISDNEIEIGVNKKDSHIIERFRDLICPDKPIYTKEKTNSVKLKLNLKEEALMIKNMFGMTTSKKHKELKFPQNIPNKYIKDFMRGYIDGDGCIDTTKAYRGNNVYIGPRLRVLGTYDFLKSFNEYTKKIYYHKTNSISKKEKEDVYLITYNFSTAKNILKKVYENNNICLNRKYERIKELNIII